MVEIDALIRIYNNINNIFTLSQTLFTLDASGITYSGAITNDHEWLVFGTNYNNIYVYKLSGGKYVHYENFAIAAAARSISLTEDHMYLAIGTIDNFAYVYKFNGTKF